MLHHADRYLKAFCPQHVVSRNNHGNGCNEQQSCRLLFHNGIETHISEGGGIGSTSHCLYRRPKCSQKTHHGDPIARRQIMETPQPEDTSWRLHSQKTHHEAPMVRRHHHRNLMRSQHRLARLRLSTYYRQLYRIRQCHGQLTLHMPRFISLQQPSS